MLAFEDAEEDRVCVEVLDRGGEGNTPERRCLAPPPFEYGLLGGNNFSIMPVVHVYLFSVVYCNVVRARKFAGAEEGGVYKAGDHVDHTGRVLEGGDQVCTRLRPEQCCRLACEITWCI